MSSSQNNPPILHEMQSHIDSQQNYLTLIMENNREILKSIDNLEKSLNKLIGDQSSQILQYEPKELSNAPYDIYNKTIELNGNIYQFSREMLICGSDNLKFTLQTIESNQQKGHNFPQGYEYCITIVQREIEKGEYGRVLILNDEKAFSWFYFPLDNFFDLKFTKMQHFHRFLCSQYQSFLKYQKDNYPQGKKYVQSVIKDHENHNCGIVILARQNKDGKSWSRYYFKLKDIFIETSDLTIEMIQGNELKNECKFIIENENCVEFPQGIKKCYDLIQNQIDLDDKIFKINMNNKTITYYFNEERLIKDVSRSIWVLNDDEIDQELNEITQNPEMHLIQGIEYCKNLFDERKKRGECVYSVHIVRYENHPTRYYI